MTKAQVWLDRTAGRAADPELFFPLVVLSPLTRTQPHRSRHHMSVARLPRLWWKRLARIYRLSTRAGFADSEEAETTMRPEVSRCPGGAAWQRSRVKAHDKHRTVDQ
jgi:hypothetical protein